MSALASAVANHPPTGVGPALAAYSSDWADETYEEVDDFALEEVALDIFAQYAGGQAIPPGAKQQWVLRALSALEAHYHELRRDDSRRRKRLEKLVGELTQRLEETARSLLGERTRRETAEAELARAKKALDAEAALRAGLETHDQALRRSQTAVEREREQYLAALDRCQEQLAETQAKWSKADAAARHWAHRAHQLQEQARVAIAQCQEARAAKVALQKCLYREKDYQLSEEAGYRLDTVVQIAPTHPTITVFGGAARRLADDDTRTSSLLDPWKKGSL